MYEPTDNIDLIHIVQLFLFKVSETMIVNFIHKLII